MLRELISSRTIPTVTLTDLFRQARGSQIVLAAHAVNHGDVPRIENATDHDLFFVEAPDEESVVNGITPDALNLRAATSSASEILPALSNGIIEGSCLIMIVSALPDQF